MAEAGAASGSAAAAPAAMEEAGAASGSAAAAPAAMEEPGAASGSAAAAGLEAPELTAAPQTPPLRPRGPFTEEEWARRRALKRKAELDASHALAPLQRWMVAEMELRHEQHSTIEHLKTRLQEAASSIDLLDRQIAGLRREVRELQQQINPPGDREEVTAL